MLRTVLAPNASPMTLDGTRVHIVGRARVAILDPGPDTPDHLQAIAAAVGPAAVEVILITHSHPDHDAAAESVARRFGAPIRGGRWGNLVSGDHIPTDAGDLVAIATPGHSPDHFAFEWPSQRSIFCGDLMMGGLDTALVASPEGSIRQYLESLNRLQTLSPAMIYPTHGEPVANPAAAIDRYITHRRDRELQVLQSLERGRRDLDEVVEDVYGTGLPPELRRFTAFTVLAYLEHLEEKKLVERSETGWRKTA